MLRRTFIKGVTTASIAGVAGIKLQASIPHKTPSHKSFSFLWQFAIIKTINTKLSPNPKHYTQSTQNTIILYNQHFTIENRG
ncbi:MAG: hypothetical protein LGB01_01480 [Sulfurovum sp.]|nr:hypothetical protein [Sulfurovum sp.]